MSNYSLHLVATEKYTAIAIIDNYRIVASLVAELGIPSTHLTAPNAFGR